MNNTELNLYKCLAQAWNELNTEHILPFMSEDIIYESQWVFSALNGKTEVLEYLNGKFETLRNSNDSKVKADLAYLPRMGMKLCLIMSQQLEEGLKEVTVLLEVKDNLISRIDICFLPDPADAVIGLAGISNN